jgi:hypothetical protein
MGKALSKITVGHDRPLLKQASKEDHVTEVPQGEVRQEEIEHKFDLATNKPKWTETSYCIHADIQTRAHAALKIPRTNAACS